MRMANLTGVVLASLVVTWLSLLPGITRAGDNQALDGSEHAFLTRAMSDNAAQVAMAKLALQKSKNPQIVALANAIINERIALDQELVALASGSIDHTALQQSATNTPRMVSLQSLSGDAFDKTFAGLLIRDHYQIISAYQTMKMTTAHDALKAVARDAVPALQGNLAVALSFLRSGSCESTVHQDASLTAATDSRATKVPVYWESMSIVAAPW
jgi:putative membrane protein